MASPNIYENGAGGTTGSELATLSPVSLSGTFWYVLSTSGTDAASPAGKERIKPLATLAQAYTNAAAGDVIVFLSGHAEALTSGQTLGKAGLRLVSEGTGANRARFTCNGSIQMFDVTAAGTVLDNIYFVQSTVAPTTARVRFGAAGIRMEHCYFECGTLDTVEALQLTTSASNCRVYDTSFVSTSSTVASQPKAGILINAALTDIVLDTVTFDGGSSGWSDPYAFDGANAITRLTATNIDLLHDSDFILATGSIYTFNARYKSGSARVVLAA